MFIAAVFTIARSWKQPKCPSMDEWIKKMWYIYTMEYYSAIERNEIGSFVETCKARVSVSVRRVSVHSTTSGDLKRHGINMLQVVQCIVFISAFQI